MTQTDEIREVPHNDGVGAVLVVRPRVEEIVQVTRWLDRPTDHPLDAWIGYELSDRQRHGAPDRYRGYVVSVERRTQAAS